MFSRFGTIRSIPECDGRTDRRSFYMAGCNRIGCAIKNSTCTWWSVEPCDIWWYSDLRRPLHMEVPASVSTMQHISPIKLITAMTELLRTPNQTDVKNIVSVTDGRSQNTIVEPDLEEAACVQLTTGWSGIHWNSSEHVHCHRSPDWPQPLDADSGPSRRHHPPDGVLRSAQPTAAKQWNISLDKKLTCCRETARRFVLFHDAVTHKSHKSCPIIVALQMYTLCLWTSLLPVPI